MFMATATTAPVLFPWKDDYSVNIGIIDSQHRTLVDLLNELHQAMMTGKGKDQVGIVLSKLVKYAQGHFKSEEGMMQSKQYPEFEDHKVEHDRFTKTVLEFQGKFARNEIGLTSEVMDFLKTWLMKHIMGVDKKYSPFLNSKGVY